MGRRTQLRLPNGVIVDYRYDTLDRLTGLTQHTTSTVLASYDYTLDPDGNRLGVTEVDGSSIAWSYDDAYRLIGETRLSPDGSPANETTYTYDTVGNRLRMTVGGVTMDYTYNELDQLLTAGGASFAYDARGNLTRTTEGADVTTYSWDALDRLSDVTLPDGTALAYGYDADGRRVRQTVDGVETNYLWDETSLYGDAVLETDGSGAIQASYLLVRAELLSQTRGGDTSSYLADGLGSTRALADETGAVTDTYTYNAFGELAASSGTTENTYLFAGQQFDALTGQYYLRARYYQPALGRFLSRDPLEVQPFNPVEINRYVYARNQPINNVDPGGKLAIDYALQGLSALEQASAIGIGLGILATAYVVRLIREPVAAPTIHPPIRPDITHPDTTDPNRAPEPPGGFGWALRVLLSLFTIGSVALAGQVQTIVEGEPEPVEPPEPEPIPTPQRALFRRFISRAEHTEILVTGLLRGGREGETYFTTDIYLGIEAATEKLSLPREPEPGIEFLITNNPLIFGPRIVGPDFGRHGGGIEYWSEEKVEVQLTSLWELLK